MHIYIITGTSRGIGEAIAGALLDPNHHLLCLSRNSNPSLVEAARQKASPLTEYSLDLSHTAGIVPWTQETLKNYKPEDLDSITLIQNAAALKPVQLVGQNIQEGALSHGVQVNLLAPMLMTEAFVAVTQDWTIPKKILNISSGAARRPVAAWSMYCSTKAALDMHSRCLATEQELQDHPIKVVSLAPGTVDTAMQDHLREQSKEVFPGVQRFLDLKKNDQLWSAEFVAGEIVKFLTDPGFGNETLMDIRNWVSQG